jgi:P4 family phage/plasmid primase-like protien
MREFKITTGKTVRGGAVETKMAEWPVLVRKLRKFHTADITMADYKQLDVNAKGELKDSFGFFIGGHFRNKTRKKGDLIGKTLLTLDLDYLDPWDVEGALDTYKELGYAYVAHTTMSHTDDAPKLRIVFPLTRDVELDEYEALARWVADEFDINAVDKVSYRPAQLMYWPANCSDSPGQSWVNEGKEIDPNEVLNSYDDWRDFGSWPCADRDIAPRSPNAKAEDPRTKGGAIGAFCRRFDIHRAIEEFDLPYSRTEIDDRYTPDGSTGGAGAIVYDDGLFLYSHHSNDVAADKNTNAYDLVRLTKFGHLDEGYEGDWAKSPSQKSMQAFAMKIPEINADLASAEGLEVVEDEPDSDGKPGVEKPKKLTFKTLSERVGKLDLPTKEECDDLIVDIASAALDDQDEEILLVGVQQEYPMPTAKRISIVVLRKMVANIKKRLTAKLADADGEISDIEELFINEVLHEHFDAGHSIARVGRLWWQYGDGVWTKRDREVVRGKFTDTILRLRKERPKDARQLVAAVGEFRTSALTGSLATMFENYVARRTPEEDPLKMMRVFHSPVINCRNCEIRFANDGSFEVHDHDPKQFHTTRVDTEYDPKAKSPAWDRFCRMIFQDHKDPEGMKRHLEEFCGYIIQLQRWLKVWGLFYGPGNNGKSAVGDVLKTMLGGASLGTDLGRFGGLNKSEFAESMIIGKQLFLEDDLTRGVMLPDGWLKTISEGKELTAAIKFADPINFRNRCVPLILANHLPPTRDLSEALRDRALVFPFSRRISPAEASDKRHNQMVHEERSGALNRFIEGIARLRARGSWDIPVDCQLAKDEWVRQSNPLTAFVADVLVLDPELPVSKCAKATEVQAAWNAWRVAEGMGNRNPMHKRHFFEGLAALGLVKSDSPQAGYKRVKGVARVELGPESGLGDEF